MRSTNGVHHPRQLQPFPMMIRQFNSTNGFHRIRQLQPFPVMRTRQFNSSKGRMKAEIEKAAR
jgi:hypothetical protein